METTVIWALFILPIFSAYRIVYVFLPILCLTDNISLSYHSYQKEKFIRNIGYLLTNNKQFHPFLPFLLDTSFLFCLKLCVENLLSYIFFKTLMKKSEIIDNNQLHINNQHFSLQIMSMLILLFNNFPTLRTEVWIKSRLSIIKSNSNKESIIQLILMTFLLILKENVNKKICQVALVSVLFI